MANFPTQEHEPQVIGRDVLAAHLQTVSHGHLSTNAVAIEAVLEATLHFG